MVIKYILFFIVFLSLDAFGASKESVWQRFEESGNEILRSDRITPEISKKHEELKKDQSELEDLEYKENETESLSTKVEAHLKNLEAKIYQKNFELNLTYLSFQREADFKSPTAQSKLIITNDVFCLGGAYGVANQKYHYFVDGCAFYGKANVGSVKNTVTYQQDTIDTYGAKISPAAGIFVSSIRSEVGLKIPILYTHQKLTRPSNTSLKEGSDIEAVASFYYRFPVEKWFLQMEYGKFLSQDTTMWGLGTGFIF